MVHLQLRLNLSKKTRLWIAIALSACFFVAEIALGFYTRSLALIADAFHVSFDLISFSIALLAIHVGSFPHESMSAG
jgi:zinc transporter 1